MKPPPPEEEVDEEGSRRRKKMTKCMACKEVEKKKKRGRGTAPDVFGKVGEEIEKGTSRDTRRLSYTIL